MTERVAALTRDEAFRWQEDAVQEIGNDIRCVATDETVDADVRNAARQITQLFNQRATDDEDVDDTQIVQTAEQVLPQLERSHPDACKAIKVASQVFLELKRATAQPASLATSGNDSGPHASSDVSRRSSGSGDARMSSDDELLVEASPRGLPDTERLSPAAFVAKLSTLFGQNDTVVLGDGSHEDPALASILGTPRFVDTLLQAGVTHVIVEHVYQEHIDAIHADVKEGIDSGTEQLKKHLENRAYPVTDSTKAAAQREEDPDRGAAQATVSQRKAQARIYAQLVAQLRFSQGSLTNLI